MSQTKANTHSETKDKFIAAIIFVVVFIAIKMLLFLGSTFIWSAIHDINGIINGLGYIIVGVALAESFLIMKKNHQRILLILSALLVILIVYMFGYFTGYLSVRHEILSTLNQNRKETTETMNEFYKNETGHTGFVGYFHFQLNRVIDKDNVRDDVAISSMEDGDMVLIEKATYWILVEAADALGIQCNGLFTFLFWYIVGLIFVTITGTNIYLLLPAKFKPQMNGGVYCTNHTKIFAYTQNGNYVQYDKTFIEGLVSNKVKKDFSKTITVAGMQGFYLEASEKKHKYAFMTFGNDGQITTLHGNCRTTYQLKKLRKIFRRLYYDTITPLDSREIDNTGGLIRTNMKTLLNHS